MSLEDLPDLGIATLRAAYESGELTPAQLIEELDAKLEAAEPSHIWIHRLSREQMMSYVEELAGKDPATLPLYGIPFAIKDNIDLAGVPTTAACPDYAYVPETSAFVVQQLIDAGAIPIGKTNLDQFATGLVGVRSPYGVPANSFVPEYIPGGSSSGSAIALAQGLVSFSLGTDTAGSGRVPAALNQLIGHKPTRGLLSCSGVVPACRSLDCVSIFALTSADAGAVLDVCAEFDPADGYARPGVTLPEAAPFGASFKVGVPMADQLQFFGDDSAQACFAAAVREVEARGGEVIEIDFAPFLEAARLLYEGPWVAERYVAIESILEERPEILHPTTRAIISGGGKPTAAAAFKAEYRLRDLKRRADQVWDDVDVILTPTIGRAYTIAEVEAEPVQLNSNLGYYTNFMNLLDFSAIAVPSGMLDCGVPYGVTFFAPAFHDRQLLALAEHFLSPPAEVPSAVPEGWLPLVVCGAHMECLPLNHQLTSRKGKFVAKDSTTPDYKFYALPPMDGYPPRPGLLRCEEGGAAIEVEVWALSPSAFGDFVAQVPAPLAIGTVQCAEHGALPGFLCEPIALETAEEITKLGGWRTYLKAPTRNSKGSL